MKKILAILMASMLLTGCTSAQNTLNDIKSTLDSTMNNAKQDIKSATTMPENKLDGVKTVGDKMKIVNEQKNAELAVIDKQIQEKEIKIAKILVDTKLTNSQKKAKTSLLQKDIVTLKQQKENVIEKYRNIMRNFKYE